MEIFSGLTCLLICPHTAAVYNKHRYGLKFAILTVFSLVSPAPMTSGLSISFPPLLLLPLTLYCGWHGQYEARNKKCPLACAYRSPSQPDPWIFQVWDPCACNSILQCLSPSWAALTGTGLFPLLPPGLQGWGAQRGSGGSVPAVSLTAGSSSV